MKLTKRSLLEIGSGAITGSIIASGNVAATNRPESQIGTRQVVDVSLGLNNISDMNANIRCGPLDYKFNIEEESMEISPHLPDRARNVINNNTSIIVADDFQPLSEPAFGGREDKYPLGTDKSINLSESTDLPSVEVGNKNRGIIQVRVDEETVEVPPFKSVNVKLNETTVMTPEYSTKQTENPRTGNMVEVPHIVGSKQQMVTPIVDITNYGPNVSVIEGGEKNGQ